MDDITNIELREILLDLKTLINENTKINKELYELLKINNEQTCWLKKTKEKELSPEEQLKIFGIDIAGNLLANSIQTPTLLKL